MLVRGECRFGNAGEIQLFGMLPRKLDRRGVIYYMLEIFGKAKVLQRRS